MKKILKIKSNTDSDLNIINELLEKNIILRDIVYSHKEKITQYYVDKSWDKYKKLSNEYELIFTNPNAPSNISKYTPVSRSFFKMWEILNDFKELFAEVNMNFLFLFLFRALPYIEG